MMTTMSTMVSSSPLTSPRRLLHGRPAGGSDDGDGSGSGADAELDLSFPAYDPLMMS
jgi:hypothetical protein